LIGILPERRKNQERITQETIMNWGKKILADNVDVDSDALYFIHVEI